MDIANTSGGARYVEWYNYNSLYPPVLTLVWNGPEVTNEIPYDGQTGVQTYLDNFTITVNDSMGLNMDINWFFWFDDSWQPIGSTNRVTNGTYSKTGISGYLNCYNHTYLWKVEVVNSGGVWANETYSYTTRNSTPPTISNMYPHNRTVFGYGSDRISFTVNDTEAQQINIEMCYFYGNCSYKYYSEMGLSNRTYSTTFKPIWHLPGTIRWFVKIQDISCSQIDNTVYSPVFWFTNRGTWSDHFCGKYINPKSLNLINTTNYTSYISPVRSQDSDHDVLYNDTSFVEFRQYMNNTVSDGINVAQSNISDTGLMRPASSPMIAFINDTVGYSVHVDFDGCYKIYISKTNDGGTTWAINASTNNTRDMNYVGMWYDGWTSGDYGHKIHLVFVYNNDIYDNQVLYGYFDIRTENITINYDPIYTFRSVWYSDGRPSITVSTDGNIFISAWGGATNWDTYGSHGVVYRSNDSGTTWTDITPSESLWGTPYGYFRYTFQGTSCILLPLGENNITMLYRMVLGYYSANYNSSNSSWEPFVYMSTAGGPGAAYHSATYWKKTGDIYMTWLTRKTNAAADIKFIKYSLTNKTWWGEKIVDNDVYSHATTIAISEGNGDLYIFYANSSTDNVNFMNISCVNSTDCGATWSVPQRLNSEPEGELTFTLGNLMSEHRIYAGWYDVDDGKLYGRSIREYTETTSYGNTGNLTSVKITLPTDEFYWCRFNAIYTTNNGVNFSIYNKTGDVLFSGLDGNNNDILSINTSVEDNRTIYLFMDFTNTSKIDWWNISFVYLNTTVNMIIPWHVNSYPLTITVNGSDNLDNVVLWYSFSTDNITWGTNQLYGIDTSSPWEYEFNFTNNTGYYQFYSIGQISCVSGNITESPPSTPDTWAYFNWNDFLQNIVSTVQHGWNTDVLTATIGGLCLMY